MALGEFLKKIFANSNKKVQDIININELIQLPNRDSLSDEEIKLLDDYKDEYLKILSSKRYLTSKDLEVYNYKEQIYMNIYLLLNIYLSDREELINGKTSKSKVDMMKQILKLKFCQYNINKIEKETLFRVIALKEIYQERKFLLLPNKKNSLMNEINKLTSVLITYMSQKHAISIEIDAYLKDISALVLVDKITNEDEMIIDREKRELIKMFELINSDKLKEIKDLKLSSLLELAYMERELEIYVYNNKNKDMLLMELEELEKEEKISTNYNYLINKIYILENKFMIYRKFGRNIIKDSEMERLYRCKFDIITFDIYNLKSIPIEIIQACVFNFYERDFYEKIIMEKIEIIVKGKNKYITDYFENDSKKAIHFIINILKNKGIKFTPSEILNDLLLLGLLLSLDIDNGLEEFYKKKRVSCWFNGVDDVDISLFSYDKVIPLETLYFERYIADGSIILKNRAFNLYELYKLMMIYRKDEEDLEFYKLPEGISEIEIYQNDLEDDRKKKIIEKIKNEGVKKTIVMPSTLKHIHSMFMPEDDQTLLRLELNEGLETISRNALKKLRVKSIVIPSTLYEMPNLNYNTIESIEFRNFDNSLALNNKNKLVDFIRMFFYMERTGSVEVIKKEYEWMYGVTVDSKLKEIVFTSSRYDRPTVIDVDKLSCWHSFCTIHEINNLNIHDEMVDDIIKSLQEEFQRITGDVLYLSDKGFRIVESSQGKGRVRIKE